MPTIFVEDSVVEIDNIIERVEPSKKVIAGIGTAEFET
jgi:hypothetical protein